MLGLAAPMTFRSPEGAELTLEPFEVRGGEAFILTLRLAGKEGEVRRICACNGVVRECPEGMSPYCDCTTDPPRLTCVPTG